MSALADMGNMRCITNLILAGLSIISRLNFVSVESGTSAGSNSIECAEYQMDEQGEGPRASPAQYFQRQIYASYWFENEISSSRSPWPIESSARTPRPEPAPRSTP